VVEILELQEALEAAYGLKRAIVVESAENEEAQLPLLGECAANFLLDQLGTARTVGLSWGRTLNAMLPFLRAKLGKSVDVVSLTGGLAANSDQANPYDIVSAVAARLGGRPHYLLAPAIVGTPGAKSVLLKEPGAREIIEWWSRLDVCMMSIGVLSTGTGIFYALKDSARQVRETRARGGVGDILARPFDRNGAFVKTVFSDRTITINIAQLKKTPVVAGVAGGKSKLESILGALKTGCLNVLITDEDTARSLLDLNHGWHPDCVGRDPGRIRRASAVRRS
jgi:DNA-binding transcriptional regulator LsrR (DeoR family)